MIALRTLRIGLSIVTCLAAFACDEPDEEDEDGVEVVPDDDVPVGAAPPPGTPNVPIPPQVTLPGTAPPPEFGPGVPSSTTTVDIVPASTPSVDIVDGVVVQEDTGIAVPSSDAQGGAPSVDIPVPPMPGGPAAGEFLLAQDAGTETDAGLEAGAPP